MRIRKRKVPLPLSLLSPVPLTDPHLFSRSRHDNLTCSSDHFTHASLPITGVDQGVQMSNNDDASNATTTRCAPAYHNTFNLTTTNINQSLLPLPLSNNEGRWCDGDKAIPLKKRRTMIMKCEVERKDEEVKSTVTSDQTSVINDDDGNNSKQVAAASVKKGSSKRGNTIMEGSRCSRVNGRGWRCCQPTLVGYSLCEHHLGKGRLRSMTTTAKAARSSSSSTTKKNNANNNNNNNNNSFAIGDHEESQTVDSKNNNNNSKRVKLGVVKARSLSSLLGQTNTMNNIVGDHANVHQQERINN